MNKINESTKKLYFPSIDGLRAISIIMVILNHLLSNFKEVSNILFSNIILKSIFRILSDGQLGVNIFFLISGFLITSILLNEELNSEISIRNFYIRRTLRIFPAYYFLLLVYFILQYFNFIILS